MNSKEIRKKIQCKAGDALIIVDLQNDFLPPHGQLAVPEGRAVIEPLNQTIDLFHSQGLPIYATRDWHPAHHCSFKPQGGPWPDHCVAGTLGAEFSKDLRLPKTTQVVSKATRPEQDAYSGFEGTDLKDQLTVAGVKRIFVGGLATDYCVLSTVKDALRHGFEVILLEDAVRAVNVKPQDGVNAVAEMKELGAKIL